MNGVLTDTSGVLRATTGVTQGPVSPATADLLAVFVEEQARSPGAVAVADRAGRLVAANSQALREFGLTPRAEYSLGTAVVALAARTPGEAAVLIRPVRRRGQLIGAVIAGSAPGDLQPVVTRVVGLHGSQYLLLAPGEIRLAEADGPVVWLSTDRGRLRSPDRGLSKLEAKLRAHGFLRVHRHTLVNLRRVRELAPTFHGGAVLVLQGTDRETVPVARRRMPDVRRALGL